MPFKFKHLVQLLQDLDAARAKSQNANTFHQPFWPRSKADQPKPKDQTVPIIKKWFAKHEADIARHGPSAIAFLSCLLPDQLPHRVYGLKEKTLASLLCKVLFLTGPGRGQEIREWETTGLDFAMCVSRTMSQAENDRPRLAEHEVTLEEIDEALQELARLSRFGPEAYQKSGDDPELVAIGRLNSEKLLRQVMRRLRSYEAKWLVRMILKSYSPVEIPVHLVLSSFHFLLPDIYPLRSSITAAVEVLGKPDVMKIPHAAPINDRYRYRQACVAHITPKLGVLIKRQEFQKARSLAHCCTETRERTMTVERKYDGFYCQIHINVSPDEINYKIISKSGKDQTGNWDRLYRPIEFGLQLKEKDCPLKGHCILEAEALIWDSRERAIQPFCKLRKHFEYHGKTIGAEADSPRSIHESPMLIYYDCLYLNGQNLIEQPHRVRRQCLEQIIKTEEGLVQLGERCVIDFGSRDAKAELREYFEFAIMRRWEGLVLKGSDDAYFIRGGWGNGIKLKPDYLKGLGDHADLCIVGASGDATEADRLGGSIDWTTFYLACLTNKESVQNSGTRPEFLILDVVTCHNMSRETLMELNLRARDYPVPFAYKSEHYDVLLDQPEMKKSPPHTLFIKPIIVEVTSARFEKPHNAPYFTPRFPRDLKIHSDRSFVETHSFEELQSMAEESLRPIHPDEQVEIDFIRQKLIEADPQKYRMEDWYRELSQSPSCTSTASRDSYAPVSSPPRPARLGEPSASPSTVTALEVNSLAVLAGFCDGESHSQSTASLSPPAAADTQPIEATSFRPPRALKRSATAPLQGTKRKPEPSLADLSPETVRVLTENNYTGPLDKMSIAFFRIENALIPKQKPQTTSQLPRKLRRAATRQPLAPLDNVPLARGSHKAVAGPKSPNKTGINESKAAKEDDQCRQIVDLTSPDKQPAAAKPAVKKASSRKSTPASATRGLPRPPSTMQAPAMPSQPLDSAILRVLRAHPLIDLV